MNDINEAIKEFDANYDLCASYILNEDKKSFLGDKGKPKCRFCGRGIDEGATFKEEAHALSHLIGNNRLFSYYECDECNHKHSTYENDFAAYMKFYHCILQVHGKNGVPSYRLWKSRMDAQNKHMDVKLYEDDPTLTCSLNEKENSVTFNGLRTYTPLNVYKALLKMALTILPAEDTCNLKDAFKFLSCVTVHPKVELPVLYNMFGGSANVYKYVAAMLFKRKAASTAKVPSYWFVLAYNNICFQMPLMGSLLDKELDGCTVDCNILPTPPHIIGFPIIVNKLLDLSGAEKIKNEPLTLSLKFETMDAVDLVKEKKRDL